MIIVFLRFQRYQRITDLGKSPPSKLGSGARSRIFLREKFIEFNTGGCDVWSIVKMANNYDRRDVSAPVDEAVEAKTRMLKI